jgi:gluconolactonase
MADLSDVIEPDAEVELLFGPGAIEGDGMTEGAVWHPEGYLTFVRHRMSEHYRWDPLAHKAVLIRQKTGRCTGAALDQQGRLVLCEGDNRRVTRIDPGPEGDAPAEDWPGTPVVLADEWQGKRLNKPNDVIVRSDGSIYFTDPAARRSPGEREIGFAGVFRITPDGEVEVATDECEYPNGLAFSPDESILYVAITRKDEHCLEEVATGTICRHRMMRAFDVAPDGTLSGNRIFADMSSPLPGSPDGLKVDSDGRVYCTGAGGVWVFGADGTKLGIITVLGPRNLAFGGADLSTLYIAAGESLYSIPTKVRGNPLPPPAA